MDETLRFRRVGKLLTAVILAVVFAVQVGRSLSSDSPRPPWQAKTEEVRKPVIPLVLVSTESEEPANPLRPEDGAPANDSGIGSTGRPSEPAAIQKPATTVPAKTRDRPKTGKTSGKPFNPIAENGTIFDGWTKPTVALVITGMEEGYLEPCGCAGMDRMKGGMGRRRTFFKELRAKGWPVVGLDVGGLVNGFGYQAELKYQTAVEGKLKMGYDAIAFGADDLRLPAGDLLAVAAGIDGKQSCFVAANVGLLGKPGEITPRSRVIEAGGVKIGVTAVLGKKYQQDIHNDEIEMMEPGAALVEVVPELRKNADYLVLLAHATKEESIALAKQFPAFQMVVTSDTPPEPPRDFQTIPGTKTLLIVPGYKGQNAVVVGLFKGKNPPVQYQRVPLDSRFASAPDMKMLMTAYQEQLKAKGFAGLGLRPVPHPQTEENGGFVGSKKCQSCHEKSYDIWKKSGHAKAYETLEKLDPPRQFDPECISCHVVGWHPTKYFPYVGGYESLGKTPHLIGVGCESCHGPGENHCLAEAGANEELKIRYRKASVITKEESKKQQCMTCHDIDNSPDFDFDLYWPFVEHYENDE
jgi:hypothetical protein